MSLPPLDRQIADLQERIEAVAELERRGLPVAAALSALQSAIKELIAAQTELQRQNEHLLAAQEKLRASEIKHRIVADFTHDWEFWIGPDGRFVYVSPSVERITGRKVAAGTDAIEFLRLVVHPDDLQRRLDHLRDDIERQSPGELEYRIVHADGSVRWMHHVCQPVRDECGRFIGTRGSNRDITERKAADAALHATHSRMKAMFEHSAAGLVLFESQPPYRVLATNRYYQQQWPEPYCSQGIVGRPLTDFAPGLEEAGIADVFRRVVETRQGVLILSTPYDHMIGGRRWWNWTLEPVIENDQVVALAHLAVEVTAEVLARQQVEQQAQALRESEERYRLLAEYTDDMVELSDTAGHVLYLSPSVERHFGLTHDDLKPGSAKVHPDDQSVVDAAYARNLAGEITTIEYRLLHNDGAWVWLEGRCTPIRDAAGVVTRLLLVSRDITARKQAEEALRNSEQRYRLLADNAADFITLHDADGRCLYRSPSFYRGTGWTDAELDPALAHTRVHPDDLPAIQLAYDANARGETTVTENRYRCKDGHWMWLETHRQPLRDADGRIYRILISSRDITERKQAEEALAASQRQLESLMNNTPALVYALDLDERFVLVNTALADLLHTTPQQMIGKHRHDFMPKEDADRHEANDCLAIEAGKAIEFEEYSQLNGRSITWLTTKFPLRDAQGRIYAVAGITADISVRKQAEEALRQSEARYRLLHESMRDPFVQTTMDGRIIDFNDAYCEMLGYAPDELRSITYQQLTPERWHAVEAAIVSGQILPRGYSDVYEKEYRRKDGTIFPVELRTILGRDAEGRPNGMWAIVRDLTERKRAEEALRASERLYRAIGESIDYGIWVCDAQGRNIYTSESLLRLVGVTQEQCAAFGWGKVLHPDDADATIAAWTQCVQSGNSWYREHRYLGVDGQYHPILACGVPVRNERGEITAWAGINLDISRLKQTQEELATARDAAQAASRAKDEFIAVLSHELRTPLSPIAGCLALLQRDRRLPADVHEDLAMMTRNLDIEVRLIADLLDVSRINAGKMLMLKQRIDVADAIRRAAQTVKSDLEEKQQTLDIQMSGAPYLTYGDAARLQQVFWNLLRNSIKFSPERGIIRIRASVEPAEHCPFAAQPCPIGMGDCPLPNAIAGGGDRQPTAQNLVVEVIDHGSGIDPAMLPKIFNAFEQERKARSFGGLGLGLSICKGVVQMHGGSIAAHSDGIDQGAIFTVRLPIAQCPRLAAPAPQTTQESATAGAQPPPDAHRLARVLLVEDHPATAKLMKRILKDQGYEVIVAGSVEMALKSVQNGIPDALICDIGLPDGSGLDIMRQLVAQGRKIPAIALSGYGRQEDIEQSKAAGFADHLVKPLSEIDQLTDALARLGIHAGPQPPGT